MILKNKLSKVKKRIYDYLDHGGYPSLNLYKRRKSKQFFVRNLNKLDEFIDKFRRIFWTNIAKKHPAFACCYKKNYKKSNNTYFREIQKNGFVEIKNFLNKKDFAYVNNEVKKSINIISKNNPFELETANKGYHPLSSHSQNLINKKLAPTIKCCFGKELKPKISLNYISSNDGENDFCNTSNWHADRFIPCINALYFPLGCDWLPFERLIMSPQIINDEQAMYLQSHYPVLKNKNTKKYLSICPPNTLILGFHHILHRRSILKEPGSRVTVFLEWYRSFNRFELIKSSLKNLFYSN